MNDNTTQENLGALWNINLLDRALFIPSKLMAVEKVYDDANGFKIQYDASSEHSFTTIKHQPSLTDYKYLNYLLLKLQQTHLMDNGSDPYILKLDSYYQIAKEMGIDPNSPENKKRFIESLKILSCFKVTYENNFYLRNQLIHVYRNFKLLEGFNDYTNIKESKGKAYIVNHEFEILFGKTFVDINSRTFDTFHKKFSMSNFNKIKSPFTARLFLILCHNFYRRGGWKIGVDNLLDKVGQNFSRGVTARKTILSSLIEISEIMHMHFTAERCVPISEMILFKIHESKEMAEFYLQDMNKHQSLTYITEPKHHSSTYKIP